MRLTAMLMLCWWNQTWCCGRKACGRHWWWVWIPNWTRCALYSPTFRCWVFITGKVIKGWDIGVISMKLGEIARFIIKPEYAYGSQGCAPKVRIARYWSGRIYLFLLWIDRAGWDFGFWDRTGSIWSMWLWLWLYSIALLIAALLGSLASIPNSCGARWNQEAAARRKQENAGGESTSNCRYDPITYAKTIK